MLFKKTISYVYFFKYFSKLLFVTAADMVSSEVPVIGNDACNIGLQFLNCYRLYCVLLPLRSLKEQVKRDNIA